MTADPQPLDSLVSHLARPARLLRKATLGAGLAYAWGVLGYALVRPLLGEREGWIELADDLEPWAYLPAPVVTLLGAAIRSRNLATAGVALSAAFGVRWGRRYLRRSTHRSADPARAAADLTVMTFNTLAWQRDGRDLEASIVKAGPDIVGLQEIGPNGAAYLAKALADRLPYSFVTESATSSGAAVLSRYPLRDTTAFRASTRGHWWQRMTIDGPTGPITYLNLHTRIPHIRTTHRRFGPRRLPLSFHADTRRGEIRALIEMLENVEGPILITGDFNLTERSPDYRILTSRLRDAYRAVGAGLGHTFPRRGSLPHSFPAPWPILRLDYVWHSEHLTPAWAYLGDPGHSDHHPVVVGLRWTGAAERPDSGVPLAASAV